MRWSWLVFVLVAACGATDTGPEAPTPQPVETVCSAVACAAIPRDWVVEVGDRFVSLTHPADPERVLGTVGDVDMEGVVAAAGGTWPATGEAVVEAFFELLGEFQSASLDQVASRPDGSVVGEGRLEGLHIWYRLIPIDSAAAIGVEVRAPNGGWQRHADLILDGVDVGPG